MVTLWACQPDIVPDTDPSKQPAEEEDPDDGKYSAKDGIEYVYDLSCVPEIHVKVSVSEWNRLLEAYDKDNSTKESVGCTVVYSKEGDITTINGASIRLRGNTSRRRPESTSGQQHKSSGSSWHHCHFQLNLHKNYPDDEHEIHGARKIILKWFKDDPAYVRELYCYDLFQRFGAWTAPHVAYCRLWIHVAGDVKETYFGVYEMIEPIDGRYAKVRKEQFEEKDGFVWKCRYGANFVSTSARMGAESDEGKEYTYELKTQTADFEIAKAQLKDFITNFNNRTGESFRSWIETTCDVELLLRTYAVNVAVGMWDDYWNNTNNFYVYFNSKDTKKYKFFFIPFDYDNTLGTSVECGVQNDSGRQNPLKWGKDSCPLISKLLTFPEYRKMYTDALFELTAPTGPFYYKNSAERISQWQAMVSPYVRNDTYEDMTVSDSPAHWSNHREYRLLEDCDNNFFKVKAESINKYCK